MLWLGLRLVLECLVWTKLRINVEPSSNLNSNHNSDFLVGQSSLTWTKDPRKKYPPGLCFYCLLSNGHNLSRGHSILLHQKAGFSCTDLCSCSDSDGYGCGKAEDKHEGVVDDCDDDCDDDCYDNCDVDDDDLDKNDVDCDGDYGHVK